MINRQDLYTALFLLKDSGLDITEPLNIMQHNKGVPTEVLEFLRENSPQYQFYAYLKKYQRAVIKNILNYENLSNEDKLIVSSSLITRAILAIKCQNISEVLIKDLDLSRLSKAITYALTEEDYTQIDEILMKYKNIFSTREDEENVKGLNN